MGRNVEIKARLAEPEAVRKRVEALADDGPIEMDQEDTFFSCPQGRLKLRKIQGTNGELIFYQRRDGRAPTESEYNICRVSDAAELEAVLAAGYGVRGVVRKHRTLYKIGRTRVHLDAVDGSGVFLELEVVLGPSESVSEGVQEAHDLMETLGVAPAALLDQAYVDMLDERPKQPLSGPKATKRP